MKTKLMKRAKYMAKYLTGKLKRKDHPLFPGVSARAMEKGFRSHERHVRTINLDWRGCPYEIVLKKSVSPRFMEPWTTCTITGITLPRYPENPIASYLVKEIFDKMRNNNSDYEPKPKRVHGPRLGGASLFKRSPIIDVESEEYVDGQRKKISYDTQVGKANIVARRVITNYLDHKKGLLELLKEIDKDYPTTLDEAGNFVREHRLPFGLSNPINNSYLLVNQIYESSDPLSDMRYCNYIPPCGGTAIFRKSVLLSLVPEGDELLRSWSYFKEIEPELNQHPVKQRYLVIDGILQRDPEDSTEQDFMEHELFELLQKYKARYSSRKPN